MLRLAVNGAGGGPRFALISAEAALKMCSCFVWTDVDMKVSQVSGQRKRAARKGFIRITSNK